MRPLDYRNYFYRKIGIGFYYGRRTVTAFLTNFKMKSYRDKSDNYDKMAVLCFFQSELGYTLKYLLPYLPYFYVEFDQGMESEVQAYLYSLLEKVENIELVDKIDLEEINHLSSRKQQFLKISFRTLKDLNNARTPLKAYLDKKRKQQYSEENYLLFLQGGKKKYYDVTDLIKGIREYDVPFHSRVCIDTGLRAGKWFDLVVEDRLIISLTATKYKRPMPDLKVLSFDIYTSKYPLKFPDAHRNEVMMISLMYEGYAFLIINCAFCGQAVEEFHYDPKPYFACHVSVFNYGNYKAVLLRFAAFIQTYKPSIITTYNGDKFDYPFIAKRCYINQIKFTAYLGVAYSSGYYYGSYISHLDCYYWVDRDAYLPQGSRGLKAVAKAKLNYEPIEVDPEDMVYMAKHNTQRLAEYSVSDAVATYFLYIKHIHGFIFALSTIIPMFPDEVLRKGSGTLCENLLMVEAFQRNIIFPNKKQYNLEKFYKGNLLDSYTYTGGKVECLRTGVYRADILTYFVLDPRAFAELKENIDEIIRFAIVHEVPEYSYENVANLYYVRGYLYEKLSVLYHVGNPNRYETYPLIYHIDVAAMYPNIILTNRLQPVSIVDDRICSGCLFNDPSNNCKRELQWYWKGQVYPLTENEYQQVKYSLWKRVKEYKLADGYYEKQLKQYIKAYCQRIYKKTHNYISEVKTDTVCMRENSFYVDNVRAFRDRRYDYKTLAKLYQGNVEKHMNNKDYARAKYSKALLGLYYSMQLAHKIILNSYYGYVMRKGARWYSMETAAMVTYIGSNIISDSKNFIYGRIGKPLELDTDGIWMLLPKGFPEDVKIRFKDGRNYKLSYPCHILNYAIYDKYANPQYQKLIDYANFEYYTRKYMTIFFYIDGPYKAMMIPAAKYKQKTTQLDIQYHNTQMLKKRYVVFGFNNKIKYFKGFEMKRRGYLRITKVFQYEIFPQYLKGDNLKYCYEHCAEIAKKYISIIEKRGYGMDVNEILDYLQYSRVLSKDFKYYGESKGVAINSARRLAYFLGAEVIKDGGGLCCNFVILAYPLYRPVTERAVPTQIFDADMYMQRHYLYRWTGNDSLLKYYVDIKRILDWGYYFERLATQIQKMVCIPAVMQNLPNPVPEIYLPEWLQKKTFDMRHHKQQKFSEFAHWFQKKENKVQSWTPSKIQTQEHHAQSAQSNRQSGHNGYDTQTPKNVVELVFEYKRQISISRRQVNKYPMKDNFQNWLTYQKRIWRYRKYYITISSPSKPTDLKSVLQIVPDKTSGRFNVWYHCGGKIHQVSMTMKRRYYCRGRGTKKAPREYGEAVYITIDYYTFKQQYDYFDSFLGRKFYETKLPLLSSLIIKKGNVWRMARQSLAYGYDYVYANFRSEYLPDIENHFMPMVYLSYTKVIGKWSMWALLVPRSHDYNFMFVDSAGKIQHDDLLNFARKYLKRNQAGKQQNHFEANIKIYHHNNDQYAAEMVNKMLINMHNTLQQYFLVVLHADSTMLLRAHGVEILYTELPVLCLGKLSIDNVSILNWRQKAITGVLEARMTELVFRLIGWARYAQIPVCNLPTKGCLLDYVTNIQFSRLLHSGDHLTWWDYYNSYVMTTYESNTFTGRINQYGLYKTYSIEIDMTDLPVNTIANADDLITYDRDTALIMQKRMSGNANRLYSLDEMSRVKKAFEYLKRMVKAWIKDLEEESDYAEELLKNLHKWITTRSNSMFDPLLLRMVNQMMKRVFYLLMRKLSNLGLRVIFANFSRVILATDKYNFKYASNSLDYVLKKCVDYYKLFRYIKLTPIGSLYKVILFKDQFNYVGITDKGEYYYRFAIEHLMSYNVGKCFKILVIHFIKQLYKVENYLEEYYVQNKRRLFLEYYIMLDYRMMKIIKEEYANTLLEIVRKLFEDWEEKKDVREIGDYDSYSDMINGSENYGGENCEGHIEEYDNGVVNEDRNYEGNEYYYDNEVYRMYYEQPKRVSKSRKANKNIDKIDIGWRNDHQIDILIENVYSFVAVYEKYKDILMYARKYALVEVKLYPSIQHRLITSSYPSFELPCANCYHVNENPGNCLRCEKYLTSQLYLENAVWKMMQYQGRDLYCGTCNRIKQGYLKKCSCGGKWTIKEQPLAWLSYTAREEPQWEFVNKVFDFMGYC